MQDKDERTILVLTGASMKIPKRTLETREALKKKKETKTRLFMDGKIE